MKELKIFYLEGCPYCRKAREAVQALTAENPAYEAVKIEWIEETAQPGIAAQYDYYRVPSIFRGTDKLYECAPGDDAGEIRRQVENALKTVPEQ